MRIKFVFAHIVSISCERILMKFSRGVNVGNFMLFIKRKFLKSV
jgi:hypothetical protein